MEALFGFDLWDVGVVVALVLGTLWFVNVIEKSKRRGEDKRNR